MEFLEFSTYRVYIIHKSCVHLFHLNSDIFCFIFYIIALAETSSTYWTETVRVDHFALSQILENMLWGSPYGLWPLC